MEAFAQAPLQLELLCECRDTKMLGTLMLGRSMLSPIVLLFRHIPERIGDRHSSYLYAGETSSRIGYLLVSDQWREIALIAFQTELFKSYSKEYQVEFETGVPEAETGIRRSALQLDAIFHPSLMRQAVGRKCKVRVGDLDTIISTLNNQTYFDAVPPLYPQRISSDLESIADRFQNSLARKAGRYKYHM
jgi:hypothetical protein